MIVKSLVQPMITPLVQRGVRDTGNPYAQYLTHYSPFSSDAVARVGNSVTVARAQASAFASYIHPVTRLVTFAAANTPRVEAEGLLVELASTNWLLDSNDMSDGGGTGNWSPVNVTGELIAAGAPDGASNCTRITITDTDPYSLLYQITAGTGGKSLSVWARKVSGTGSITLADYTQAQVTTAVGTTWTRCTAEYATADGNGFFAVAFSGEIGEQYDIAFAQLEDGIVSSYILTAATAVTRPADVYSMANSNIGGLNAAHTLVAEVNLKHLSDGTTRRLLCIRGETQERSILLQYAANDIHPQYTCGLNNTDLSKSASVLVQNTSQLVIASMDPSVTTFGTTYMSLGREARVSHTRSGNATGAKTNIDLGHRNGLDQIQGHIKNLRVYNVCIPQADYDYVR